MNARTRSGPLVGVLVVAALLAVRSALSPHDIVRGFDVLLLVIMASAWNLVGGYGGLFSVGHAMFVGTGSYATGMLIVRADVPLGLTLLLTALIAGAVAAVVALPLLRLRAAYFSVASLGIALAAQAWMLNWDWTGASTGLNLPLSSYVDPTDQYLLAVTLAAITVGVVTLVVRTGLGMRLMALRDDEGAAAEIGIRRMPVALVTWTISGMLTGLAGALLAIQKSSLEPVSAFSLAFTLDMIVASVIGGLGTIVGPIVGAFVIYGLRQSLQDAQSWASVVNGVLIIVVIRFAPRGIWGSACELAVRRRPVEQREPGPLLTTPPERTPA